MSFYDYIRIIMIKEENFKSYVESVVYFFNRVFILKMYSKAFIYGIEMDSLNSSYSRISRFNLLENWHEPFSYSSWFKLRSCNYDKNTLADDKEYTFLHKNDSKKRYLYGQFNYFFEFKPTFEPLLKTVLVASVLIRNHSKNTNEYIDKININATVDTSLQFVSLSDVYSTRIMTCAVSKDNYPIQNPHRFYGSVSKTSSSYIKDIKSLTHLIMFTLNSDRNNIKDFE